MAGANGKQKRIRRRHASELHPPPQSCDGTGLRRTHLLVAALLADDNGQEIQRRTHVLVLWPQALLVRIECPAGETNRQPAGASRGGGVP